MPDQRENAANAGDLLKHAILLEVLDRALGSWLSISYCETHGGLASSPPNQHVRRLRGVVRQIAPPSGPGSTYYELLRGYWDGRAHGYPGSLLLASLLVSQHQDALWHANKLGRWRVIEKDPFSASTLSALAVRFPWITVCTGEFQGNISWMIGKARGKAAWERRSLVALVDPWRYERDSSNPAFVNRDELGRICDGAVERQAGSTTRPGVGRACILVWTSIPKNGHAGVHLLRDAKKWARSCKETTKVRGWSIKTKTSATESARIVAIGLREDGAALVKCLPKDWSSAWIEKCSGKPKIKEV